MESSDSDIYFYRVSEAYGEFSNFYARMIYINDQGWRTTEHYFQAMKFINSPDYMNTIRNSNSGRQAANLGRSRDYPLREDWEEVKDEVMYEAVKTKFSQHSDLKEILLSTGSATLIEHTEKDAYWADGGDGSGKKMLGIILMRVRDELREEEETPTDT